MLGGKTDPRRLASVNTPPGQEYRTSTKARSDLLALKYHATENAPDGNACV